MGKNNRNSLCWCGSGKKYKKCHLNRDKEPKVTRGELEAHTKKQSSKKTCSVSNLYGDECVKKIINAHTISKSGSLKEIAENGHVMGAKPSLSSLIKTGGRLTLEKVGIGKASAFTGFCAVHDKNLFSPLEDEKITLTDQQLFLLAYRGMCREVFHKEAQTNTATMMKEADRGTDELMQYMLQSAASGYEFGIDLALRDLKEIKHNMDSILVEADYSRMSHCIFEFDEVPKVLVSAMIAPDMDFHGNKLQDLGNPEHVYNYIFFNCISYDGKGCFVFSWIKEHDEYCSKFVSSLLELDDQEVENALVRFCYSFSENTWAAPSWWESLTQNQKSSISDRLHHGTPLAPQTNDCLMDDGHIYNAFSIIKRELRTSPL